MVIFQIASSSHVGSFRRKGVLWLGHVPSSTTFRDSPYINELNRVLKHEIEACAIYSKLVLSVGLDCHQIAARELVRLIVAHRGVPDDHGGFTLSLARRFLGICDVAPSGVAKLITSTTLRQFELKLVERYDHLISIAPISDQVILNDLLTHQLNLLDSEAET